MDHPLSDRGTIGWSALRGETVPVQDWAGSHATREYYASLLGAGAPFRAHPAISRRHQKTLRYPRSCARPRLDHESGYRFLITAPLDSAAFC